MNCTQCFGLAKNEEPEGNFPKMKEMIKKFIFSLPILNSLIISHKANRTLKKYRYWREKYHSLCVNNNFLYREDRVPSLVAERLKVRGYVPPKKKLGQIHTFAAIPRIGWHKFLYEDFHELGPVSEFDYLKEGYQSQDLRRLKSQDPGGRDEMNDRLFQAALSAHKIQPLDWIFFYGQGFEVSPALIQKLQKAIGVPVVNMCLDDKQSWIGKPKGEHNGGQIDLAPVFDLSWTSSRVTCEWYLAVGGCPIFLPEGCNANFFKPRETKKDISASFIGANYGFRENWVSFLRNYKIDVRTFGPGWPEGLISDENMVDVLCRSQVNIGMGGIDYSEMMTNVKGRDFEIPCTGGGVYITSFNPELALFYDIGKEIVCYRSKDELLELIRYYLQHLEEATEISNKGRERCLKEHRWFHRYVRLCQTLGILGEQ